MKKLWILLPIILLSCCVFGTATHADDTQATTTTSTPPPLSTQKVRVVAKNGSATVFSKTLTPGSKIGSLKTPKKVGYKFLGWYAQGKKVSTKTIILQNTTLHAKWQAKTYKVKFVNTLIEKTTKKTLTFGKTKYPNAKYTICKLMGWSTKRDGKVKYKVGSKTKDMKEKTLYSVWKLPTIKVAKATRWMKVYSAKTGKVVRKCHINIGAPGSETPLGTYHILRKARSDYMEDAYKLYGVRGVEWTSYWTYSGHAIHATVWCYYGGAWHMGQAISHGCLNATTPDAKYIYQNCPIGTKIVITNYKN